MSNNEKIWESVLGELKLLLSEANFNTWFKETKIINIEKDKIIVGVPHTFAQEWIQQKFHKIVLESLKNHYPEVTGVEYQVSTHLREIVAHKIEPELQKNHTHTNPNTKKIEHSSKYETTINPNYTFDNFIVGSFNRLSYAAAKAVVKKPGEAIRNPLYFYGGVGLGKTHLLQAIGNEILKKYPKKRVVYAPCEKFANEYIQAIQKQEMDKLKAYYRNADILLIDDIQFLSGKEGTQEEFFHTFNALHQGNRQIVMTSDSRPDMIPKIAERLSSRFNGGMVADFQSPDFETRQAILKSKCEEKGLIISDELISDIAQAIQSNIRELEGVLNKIIAHCDLYGVEPSAKLISTIIKQSTVKQKNVHINADEILMRVAEHFSVEKNDIKSKKRTKDVSYARQIAMFLLREEIGYSHPKIGEVLGGRDHTTIMHGVNKIKEIKDSDDLIGRDLSLIKEQLYSFN